MNSPDLLSRRDFVTATAAAAAASATGSPGLFAQDATEKRFRIIGFTKPFQKLIKDMDPRHMGVCFDIGHATLEGGLSWPIESRLMERQFTAVFVKDFLWRRTDNRWREQWVPLGDGMVDKAFFKWLKTTSFTGPISQHHEFDHGEGRPMIAKMQKDLKVLREWLAA